MSIIGKEQDYETENDARTLKDAHDVRSDPKRHKKAIAHLKKAGKAHKDAYTAEKSMGDSTSEASEPTED